LKQAFRSDLSDALRRASNKDFADGIDQASAQAFLLGLTQAFTLAMRLAFGWALRFGTRDWPNRPTTDYLASIVCNNRTAAANGHQGVAVPLSPRRRLPEA
jgi:hypothetical protein